MFSADARRRVREVAWFCLASNEVDMTDEPYTALLYDSQDGVATISLDRPEVLNAMNFEMMTQLDHALARAADDSSIRVLVLTGRGEGFCSGADLSSVADSSSTEGEAKGSAESASPVDPGDGVAKRMREVFNPPILRLNQMPIPTVARLNGVVAGGGLGLALGCDIAIAAQSASLVSTFVPRMGIVPDLASSWHLPRRLGRGRALGMALMGDRIPAQQAADWGLIWAAVADDQLDDAVDHLVARLKKLSGDTVARTRAIMDGASDRSIAEQLEAETEQQSSLVPRNMVAAASAFLAKRDPDFER